MLLVHSQCLKVSACLTVKGIRIYAAVCVLVESDWLWTMSCTNSPGCFNSSPSCLNTTDEEMSLLHSTRCGPDTPLVQSVVLALNESRGYDQQVSHNYWDPWDFLKVHNHTPNKVDSFELSSHSIIGLLNVLACALHQCSYGDFLYMHQTDVVHKIHIYIQVM